MPTRRVPKARRSLLLPLALLALGGAPAGAQVCAGDCDGGAEVVISELVRCTGIALGEAALAACDACDPDGDTLVAINELIAAVGAALTGCPEVPVPSAAAHFSLAAEGPLAWGDVPFPSDLYRDATGAIRIAALPTGTAEAVLHTAMRELVQTRDGFCATCNVYFRITGDIDPATLPSGTAPATGDAVLLADVDPASPERGRLFPLRLQWDPEHGLLALRPDRGIALHRTRRYAAVLTTGVRAADGTPLAASDAFRRALAREPVADPAIERARVVLAPVLDELERLGIGRNRLVALAAYTTEDVTADVLGARAAVQAGAAPEVTIERVRRGTELDELLGIPGEDRPGIDVPPAAGVAGTRSIRHAALETVVTGEFLAPRLVSGTGTEIGTVQRDESGAIVAGPREAVPFVLTLPAGAGPEVPVVITHHGFSASRTTGFATADTVARVGAAVLAIDAFQHGDRAVTAVDERHAIRGNVPGPDGFAETMPLDVTARVFGLLGAEPGLELFPGYSHGSLVQFGADIASAVRVLREDTLIAALAAAGVTEVEGFDTERIGYIGISLGSVVGASVLTAEPDIRFGVQNVAPGSIVETLVESPEFRVLVDAVFLPLLGLSAADYDEVERHLIFDPIVDISRWILEPVDPLALAPYLLQHPVRAGGAPDILFQTAVLDEVASVSATESMIAASGASNVTRYDPAAHSMIEVLNQVSRFEPPAVPPFRPRPTEVIVVNPIVAVHDEIEAFVAEELGQ